MAAGLPEEKLFDTGFPVHPSFAEMAVLPEDASVTPFRVLYFPTSKKPHIRRTSRALLRSSPQVCLTIVMGKNLRLLYRRAMELKREFPGRVRLIGWTRRVPELLCSHHLVVGKAGGATVHEAIAAQCPMLVHHLVPGQEQGNLHLLEDLGAGALTETPEQISEMMQRLLAQDAAEWRKMKRKLAEYRRNDGGERAARAILQAIGHSEPHG
jgi:processive 1,2-diacylglycerol beta-glucosyltransferase